MQAFLFLVEYAKISSSSGLHAAAGCCLTASSSSDIFASLCTLTPMVRGLARPSWLTCKSSNPLTIQQKSYLLDIGLLEGVHTSSIVLYAFR